MSSGAREGDGARARGRGAADRRDRADDRSEGPRSRRRDRPGSTPARRAHGRARLRRARDRGSVSLSHRLRSRSTSRCGSDSDLALSCAGSMRAGDLFRRCRRDSSRAGSVRCVRDALRNDSDQFTAVGGLRDTVSDPGTGIRFDAPTVLPFLHAVERGDRARSRSAAMWPACPSSSDDARLSSWTASWRWQYVEALSLASFVIRTVRATDQFASKSECRTVWGS